MSDALFDTTLFIDLLRGDRGAVTLWERVERGELVGGYSPVSVTELWSSPRFNPIEWATFSAMLSMLEFIPVTRRASELAGMFVREISPDQRLVFAYDALIGATALDAGIPLYTRNVRHLDRFTHAVRRY